MPFPEGKWTIPAALAERVSQTPWREAVVDGDERISYRQLGAAADDITKALIGWGVEIGDRVAIWAPNSAAWIELALGVYAAGAVLVPLNTRFKPHEAAHILRTSRARLLFAASSLIGENLSALLDGAEDLGGLEATIGMRGQTPPGARPWPDFVAGGAAVDPAASRARTAAVAADSVSDIIFTSGTTGAPKGAMLTHGASVQTYSDWVDLVDLQEGDRYLVVYPFFHTAGLKSGVLASILRGATIYPYAVFDVPAVLRLVQAERITVLPGPPTVFQSILNHPELGSFDLSSIRSSVTGAAVVPVEVIRQMRETLKIRTVVTGYGMTETTGTISMCRFDDPADVVAHTVGRPIPGVKVRVVDDEGIDVAAGAPGELVVAGYNVMQGYFADPDATRNAIRDGWLHTGDIGFIDDNGNLHITGRKKDMYIVGGFNVAPAEVEAVLLDHPAVAQVAVVGVPDERMGEVGVAFVIPRGDVPAEADGILAWALERLANYKLASVQIVSELPLNASGKVLKYELRDRWMA
jgi:acyl-CoA synthetase (AMP-forming)/AMP-acid ligase II